MEWIESVDHLAIAAVDALDPVSPGTVLLNRILGLLQISLIKMGPLVLLLFYTWFRRASPAGEGGSLAAPCLVVRGMLGIAASLAIGRLLQNALPMRPRPFTAQPDAFPFEHPIGLESWSSLPSDHAALVAALVMAIWAASRPLGLLAAAWGLFGICLPRILLGAHYVSDILAGLALGVAVTGFVLWMPLPRPAWSWLGRLDARRPSLVILGLFVLGWEMVYLFGTARQLAEAGGRVLMRTIALDPG
ncbi:phosphatase PAP2 family protein [Crenalkalicoccus roseus]|uniref:phosphatase PAP2 family protein n=1 Tax=Crenalkalicoccus roseus TaxID=1485588 RepID=UPI001080E1C8|nr:phosphatase PAP2 family protein [Crenalkalicoccus roseus]